MMQGQLDELSLIGVFDRGVPNQEHVAIRVDAHVDMASYGMLVGWAAVGGGVLPVPNNFFWFGNGLLSPGDWIFLYTAPGQARVDTLKDGKRLCVLHWGRTQTMFHTPSYVPLLVRIDAYQTTPPAPELIAQGGLAAAFPNNFKGPILPPK